MRRYFSPEFYDVAQSIAFFAASSEGVERLRHPLFRIDIQVGQVLDRGHAVFREYRQAVVLELDLHDHEHL